MGFWLAHVGSNGLGHFPTDWDTLNYHLPLVDHWLQAKSLYAPDCGMWSSPGNNEVLALWATGPFSGDFLASLNNLLPTILFACSAMGVALRLGLPSALAHLGAIAVTANHVVLHQLIDNGNDVAVAACFFAAIFYVFRLIQGESGPNLQLAAISIGLLAGIKFYAAGYAVLALASLVMAAAVVRGRCAAWSALLVGIAGVFLLGGYWYIRNLALTGSPVYPKEFFKESDIFSKIYLDSEFTSLFGNRRPETLRLLLNAIWQLVGPCQLSAFLLSPLALIWLLSSGIRSRYGTRKRRVALTRCTLVILLAGTAILLGITPFGAEDSPGSLNQLRMMYGPARYGICLLSFSALILLSMVHEVIVARFAQVPPGSRVKSKYGGRASLIVFAVGLAGAALLHLAQVNQRLHIEPWTTCLFATNFVFLTLTAFTVVATWPRLQPLILVILLTAALTLSAWAGATLSDHWHRGFDAYYAKRLDILPTCSLERKYEDPVTICVLDSRYYPYFGAHREHRVCQPLFAPTSSWLMDYLRRKDVQFVVHRRRPFEVEKRRFGVLRNCLERCPNSFSLSIFNRVLQLHNFLSLPRRPTQRSL